MKTDAKEQALLYLQRRERTGLEVRKYLQGKGYQETDIEAAIGTLEELHYIDDERYCELYIRYALSKGKGKYRIKRELAEKGVAADLIQIAAEQCFGEESEEENALKQARKIVSNHEPLDEKRKAKIGRKLYALGYDAGVIYEVIARLAKEAEEVVL